MIQDSAFSLQALQIETLIAEECGKGQSEIMRVQEIDGGSSRALRHDSTTVIAPRVKPSV